MILFRVEMKEYINLVDDASKRDFQFPAKLTTHKVRISQTQMRAEREIRLSL